MAINVFAGAARSQPDNLLLEKGGRLHRTASWIGFILASAAALAASLARAQEPPKTGSFPVSDPPFECRDFRGQRVVTMATEGLGDVARSRIIGRIPYIQLDTGRLATLPPKLQNFFFGHECGHHVLAHNFYPTPTVESDADCWSIMNGRDRGLYTRDDVIAFRPYLEHSKGSPFGHLPGPERADHLVKCFDETREFARR